MFHIFFQTPADETEELLHQHGQTASALHAFLIIGHDCSMSPRGEEQSPYALSRFAVGDRLESHVHPRPIKPSCSRRSEERKKAD
jgi:hypothetical protein